MTNTLAEKLLSLKPSSKEVEVNENYFTLAEYQTVTGLGRTQTGKRLQQLVASGKLHRVKFLRKDSVGRITPTTGYELVEDDNGNE